MPNSHRDRAYMARPGFVSELEAVARVHDVPTPFGVVRWRSFGNGPPLVLLHGGHGSWMHWIRNIEALSREHQLWVPDLPGFGESCDLDEDGDLHAPLRRLTLALKHSLDHLVGSSTLVDVTGFSFGALVAAHLHRARGGFHRLVLLGPAGHGTHWRREVQMPSWRDSGPDSRRERLAHNLRAFMVHDPACIDDVALHAHEISSLRGRYNCKDVARASRLGELLRDCDAPVLLAWGEHDATGIAEQVGPGLVAGAPNRRWCVVPAAAHWVQLERADRINALVADWCSAQAPRFA